MRVVTGAQMKQIEQNALKYDLTFHRLMENAGSAAAAYLRRTLAPAGRNVMVFCSRGNNGGDGLVVARKLYEDGANVVVVMLDGIPKTEEASAMYQMAQMMDLPILDFTRDYPQVSDLLEQSDILVDAICGTGFHGSLRDVHRRACQAINDAIAAIVSLDVPTGVECDTGYADPDAIRADFTIAFDSRKRVHVLPTAVPFCGTVEVVDIGIPEEAHDLGGYDVEAFIAQAVAEEHTDTPADTVVPEPVEPLSVPDPIPEDTVEEPVSIPESVIPFEIPFASASMMDMDAQPEPEPIPEPVSPTGHGGFLPVIDTDQVFRLLPVRKQDSHKGDFGHLLNIAGSRCYRGAAVLSTLAALRCGTGLVTLASTHAVCDMAAGHILESVWQPLPATPAGGIDFDSAVSLLEEPLRKATALLVGPGLGLTTHTERLLSWVLEHAACPVVVDADGINALARNIHVLEKASATVVLTPHPGEMARLCGISTREVQQNRAGVASGFASARGVTVALKGSGTIVASPDGSLAVNHTGNSGLAKGGSGDLLAGMVGGFLAQGLSATDAAVCAVHLHGLAADRTAARRSMTAMLPVELLEDFAGLLAERGR